MENQKVCVFGTSWNRREYVLHLYRFVFWVLGLYDFKLWRYGCFGRIGVRNLALCDASQPDPFAVSLALARGKYCQWTNPKRTPNWYSRWGWRKLSWVLIKWIIFVAENRFHEHTAYSIPFFWCSRGTTANSSRMGSHLPRQSFYRHQWRVNAQQPAVCGWFWTNRWRASQKNYHWCCSGNRRDACRKSGQRTTIRSASEPYWNPRRLRSRPIPHSTEKTQLWIFERACTPSCSDLHVFCCDASSLCPILCRSWIFQERRVLLCAYPDYYGHWCWGSRRDVSCEYPRPQAITPKRVWWSRFYTGLFW